MDYKILMVCLTFVVGTFSNYVQATISSNEDEVGQGTQPRKLQRTDRVRWILTDGANDFTVPGLATASHRDEKNEPELPGSISAPLKFAHGMHVEEAFAFKEDEPEAGPSSTQENRGKKRDEFRRKFFKGCFSSDDVDAYFIQGFVIEEAAEELKMLEGCVLPGRAKGIECPIYTGVGFVRYVYNALKNPSKIPYTQYSTQAKYDTTRSLMTLLVDHSQHLYKDLGYNVLGQIWFQLDDAIHELERALKDLAIDYEFQLRSQGAVISKPVMRSGHLATY